MMTQDPQHDDLPQAEPVSTLGCVDAVVPASGSADFEETGSRGELATRPAPAPTIRLQKKHPAAIRWMRGSTPTVCGTCANT